MSAAEDRAFREAQIHLQTEVGQTVAGILATVTLLRTADVRAWVAARTADAISAGQWQAGELSLSYMRGLAPFRQPPDLERALQGLLITADHPGAVFGLVRLWGMLDEGYGEMEARERAGSVTSQLAQGDLQRAQRVGLDEAAHATGATFKWRKVPSPGACDWCRQVAGPARYADAGTVPFHRGDQCGVASELVQAAD